MKIEKITENKIRILVKSEDLDFENLDLHTIMTKAIEQPQGFFLDLLNRAEAEVGFNTDGYKLLIEAYSSIDEDLVFTITKYLDVGTQAETDPRFGTDADVDKFDAGVVANESVGRLSLGAGVSDGNRKSSGIGRKKVVPRKKLVSNFPKNRIYSFENFDAFCELCTYLKRSKLQIRGIAKSILLREFKGTYYLIISELNEKIIGNRNLFAAFSEFGKFASYSPVFQSKLQEHGHRVINHNALNKGIKYFA